MRFQCIGCESNKCKSHLKRDAKEGDLISIACCQNCGLVQLIDIPNEKDLFEEGKPKPETSKKRFFGFLILVTPQANLFGTDVSYSPFS